MRRASEYLMQRYYWAAKTVTQLNTILLQNIEERLFPQSGVAVRINERFNDVNGLIDIADDDTFEDAVGHAGNLPADDRAPVAQGHDGARHARAVARRFKIDAAFRADPVNRALFLRIMQAPVGIIHALRRMNDLSILGRYLPNFRKIVGQMQHDLFHVYTVDQHILMVVRNMRRFTMAEHAHEYPFCSQLMANFGQPWVLYVAALFHDIAKGRGGDHSKLGMADAEQFCRDHGMSDEDTELVVFLVENHLTMSQVAQKQDLSDPDVIQPSPRWSSDERHLTGLYLLTVADIRGTSPKVWNAWKAKLLEDLYKITLRVLGGEPHSADRELRNRQQEALATLRLYGLPADAHEASGSSWTWPTSCATTPPTSPGRRARCTTSSTASSRWSNAAWRRSAKACRWRSTSRTSPTCSRASAAISTARTSASSTPRSTPRATATRWTPSWSPSRTSPRTTATSSA
jgi:[protein-PII] uridylyltransferase